MEYTAIKDVTGLRALGRTNGSLAPLTLFWTGSGAEFAFDGSELTLHFDTDYTQYEHWVVVELNGCPLVRLALPMGRSEVIVFRGMTPGVVRRVRVLNQTQAMEGDARRKLQLLGVSHTPGAFHPLPAKAHRLEFLGDSITSGEGAIGARAETDWVSAFFDFEKSYARMTADALDADFHILSQSGWGALCGWDNDPRRALPDLYEQVCGVPNCAQSGALGAYAPWDFASWQPDAVIVNLGTNDESAFHNPAWRGAAGEMFQLCPDDNGFRLLEDKIVDTFQMLRRLNPRAHIVWAYGMLGQSLYPLLSRAHARYVSGARDNRAHLLLLPDTTEKTVGARCHPGAPSHAAAAKALTAFLRALLTPSA